MLKLESLKGFSVGKHFAPKPDVTFSAVIRNAYKLDGSPLLCVHVCVPTHAGVHGDQRSTLGCVFWLLLCLILRGGSLAEPEENTFLPRMAEQCTRGTFQSLSPSTGVTALSGFHLCAGGPSSLRSSGTINTLPTELFPKPRPSFKWG